jgi:hypothetical protein
VILCTLKCSGVESGYSLDVGDVVASLLCLAMIANNRDVSKRVFIGKQNFHILMCVALKGFITADKA